MFNGLQLKQIYASLEIKDLFSMNGNKKSNKIFKFLNFRFSSRKSYLFCTLAHRLFKSISISDILFFQIHLCLFFNPPNQNRLVCQNVNSFFILLLPNNNNRHINFFPCFFYFSSKHFWNQSNKISFVKSKKKKNLHCAIQLQNLTLGNWLFNIIEKAEKFSFEQKYKLFFRRILKWSFFT